MALATIPVVVRGLFVPSGEETPRTPPPAPGFWPLGLAAAGSVATIVGVAMAAPQRKAVIAMVSVIPLLALAAPVVLAWLGRTVGESRVMAKMRSPAALVPLLAVVPPVMVFAVSYIVALTAERTFVQFIPYIVIVAAAGLAALWPKKAQFIPAAVSLAAALVFGFSLHKQSPSTPRDYEALAQAIQAELKDSDVIFTRGKHWAFSPVFYYLPGDRFVGSNFQEAVEQGRGSRFWLLDFPDAEPTDPEALAALAGYRMTKRIDVRNGAALLYEAPAP